MNDKITPSLRLKQLIEKKRISKKKFAELCNCNPATISRILNEKCPISTNLLERFSDILGVSKEYIMCETDNPNPEINLLDFMESNNQWQIVNSTLDFFNNLGFNFTEKVQIGSKMYIRSENEDFYLENNNEIRISESSLCETILSSMEPVLHIYAIPKSIPDSINIVNVIHDELENEDYKHISAEEFYSYIENYINFTRAYLSPYRVRNSFFYPKNAIDKAIEKIGDLPY